MTAIALVSSEVVIWASITYMLNTSVYWLVIEFNAEILSLPLIIFQNFVCFFFSLAGCFFCFFFFVGGINIHFYTLINAESVFMHVSSSISNILVKHK